MHDLIIIGAGWAGFNAALKAKKLGLKVALIERSQIGGTCLNLGCIPTKALIRSVRLFNLAKNFSNPGIENLSPRLDLTKIQEDKDKIVEGLRAGMRFMLKGVDLFSAEARLLSPVEVGVENSILKAKFILIASGSCPAGLSRLKFDGLRVISSNEALALKEVPKTLLIVGGGVIGCEFASLFCGMGTRVSVIEKMPQLLPGEDPDASRRMENIFKKRGIQVITGADFQEADLRSFELILVCVGRRAQTDLPGMSGLGIKLDNGRIAVDGYLRTSQKNIYAAGDCASRIMLAHFAGYQGCLAVENMFGPARLRKKIDSAIVPGCIFTDPEIASVGLSEEKARQAGIVVDIHRFDFMALGSARILGAREGFLKIISDKKTGVVLGGVILGPRAAETIGILTLAVSCRLKIGQLRGTIFAHPTLSESIGEALK